MIRRSLLVRGPSIRITPESADWKYVGFQVVRLVKGDDFVGRTGEREVCAVILGGRIDAGFGNHEWRDIGARANVFEGLPFALYAPPGGELYLKAVSDSAEVALCWAPASIGAAPALIRPEDIHAFQRGSGRVERMIRNILMEDQPAEALLVAEVLTPAGNWSSFPPHKHDTDDLPREAYLEEVYYHRLARPDGFAVQLVYTDDRSLDEAIQVRDGDVVLVPRGYHPVAAGPGYDLYYLNVMAGPHRAWAITTDPNHRWQLD
ncbi:MAG TPA: 5-deoxy-glucuronate isomerase [Candidatus Dormibacteraeota bacterium]|nr:5-deoxy-glucuronate isomerase [Candidatus Dormibacteraeota bacterium]